MQVAERAEAVGLLSAFARAAVAFGGRFIWARPTGDPREIPMLERAYAALGADEPALRERWRQAAVELVVAGVAAP